MLALAQAHDSRFVSDVDGEMETTDALDGQDLTGHEAVDRLGHWIIRRNLCPVRRDEPNPRTADGAGVGLRMKAAVGGIVVLRLAGRAHLEIRHRGLRAVVGNPARDGEARAAIRAVQKRIAIAAIVRIEQLAQAVGTRRRIGGNAGRNLAAGRAGDDTKTSLARGPRCNCNGRIDAREGRSFSLQPAAKGIDAASWSFDFDGDTAGVVADKTCETLLRCEPVDEGPKTHTLHNTAHGNRLAPQQPFGPAWIWIGFLRQLSASLRHQHSAAGCRYSPFEASSRS